MVDQNDGSPARPWEPVGRALVAMPGNASSLVSQPCQDHPVFVDLDGAPAGAATDLETAFARADALSGLRFHLAGTTIAELRRSWRTRTTSPQPGGWPPVTITWSPPGPGTLGDEAGQTSTEWVATAAGGFVFVSAGITLNGAENALYHAGPGGQMSRVALFEHEIGHLLGLAHVKDATQLMYAIVGATPDYGAGDRAGLAALGRGRCLTVPDAGES